MQWIATSACNLTCPHCYSSAGARAEGELSADEVERLVVDELVALGGPMFVIAGGEALLRKDIGRIVATAHARGLRWSVHTHGGLIERRRELFAAHPPALAAVSLDGPRELHDRFRGREGSFDAALAAVGILKAAGCGKVVLGTTVTRLNADRLSEMFPTVLASGAGGASSPAAGRPASRGWSRC